MPINVPANIPIPSPALPELPAGKKAQQVQISTKAKKEGEQAAIYGGDLVQKLKAIIQLCKAENIDMLDLKDGDFQVAFKLAPPPPPPLPESKPASPTESKYTNQMTVEEATQTLAYMDI